jgi:flagellar motor switch protein FliM
MNTGHASMNNNALTLPVFPSNDRASLAWARVSTQVERMHDAFIGQWRQALSAIVPASIEIDTLDLDCKPYSQFIKDAPAFSDIQVYEVEALENLCAWSLDVGFVSAAVDSMFGGTGRALLQDVQKRNRSPIETGVRRRLFESLATAYESTWQAQHPIRLNPLRQEALLSSLRLTASVEQVVHARYVIRLNGHAFALEQCLPLRALEVLGGSPPEVLPDGHGIQPEQNPMEPVAVPERLQAAQVEVVAMLGELQLTVAQLMSLSIGQVVPFQMNEHVPLQVDGVNLVGGRSGVRNGRHAVKVSLSSPINLQGLKAEFTPLMPASEVMQAADSEAVLNTPVDLASQQAQTLVQAPSSTQHDLSP